MSRRRNLRFEPPVGWSGGWQLGGIAQTSSGVPLGRWMAWKATPWVSSTPNLSPFPTAFPDASSLPTVGTPRKPSLPGKLGRNTVIGPGLVNFDFSMIKNNQIPRVSENFAIQFRAEFFQPLPSHEPRASGRHSRSTRCIGNPLPGFGQIGSTQVPNREIQFAIKFTW